MSWASAGPFQALVAEPGLQSGRAIRPHSPGRCRRRHPRRERGPRRWPGRRPPRCNRARCEYEVEGLARHRSVDSVVRAEKGTGLVAIRNPLRPFALRMPRSRVEVGCRLGRSPPGRDRRQCSMSLQFECAQGLAETAPLGWSCSLRQSDHCSRCRWRHTALARHLRKRTRPRWRNLRGPRAIARNPAESSRRRGRWPLRCRKRSGTAPRGAGPW